ncbi:hypothetical protein [Clostridium gasigenes]|uniref:Uncharacterized protein n=1 Tax=Clostridium gasigenes TaxID=94869 RepID=A0A7X0VQ15_9CLOT|nr:hypothetical protein [Clostridium gasigenes]MBB6713849.1 hypothetical protein [Clostridium gasigenes]MBU3131068.1 hypothetical protein [Clostridium gasigenes]NKF07362.1 hypothetical protein [Clostridium gasigenes]QSW18331.1 hypothetical protein J1C67_12295 [Clostridium gasigenes]
MDKEILEILKSMQSDLTSVKSDVKSLESKVDKNTQILRALEDSSQVNKAEHDNMSNDIAKIKGAIEKMNKELNRVEQATANNWVDIAELKATR